MDSLERYWGFASKLAAYARERLRPFTAMRHSVGVRLLGSVLLFSGCVTLVLTLLQLYLEYRHDVSALELRLKQISESYLDSLSEGLWALDEKQLRLQLTGILRLPDIRAVEVREAGAARDQLVIRLAEKSESPAITREYPLRYSVQGQDTVIGTLYVQATLADVYRRLFNTALTILGSQAAKTFLVSLFIVYIFHKLITRHLFAIATFVDSYRIHDPPSPLQLRRPPRRHEDELQRVVTAFNALSDDLQIAYRSLHDANEQLARDVAARRRAEAVLREREARIRRLVDANIIGIFIWDFGGQILEANDAFLRMVGYDREDLASGRLSWTGLTPPEWLDRDAQQWVPEVKMTGRLQPFEKEYFRKDGSRVPVLIGVARFEESGNQGVAFVLDLTERKRAEEALRRSEAYLAEAQKLSHTGSWARNMATGETTHSSDEHSRLFGFDPELGVPSFEAFAERIHPEDRATVTKTFGRATRERTDFEVDFRTALPDGTIKCIHGVGHPVFNAAGDLVEYVGTAVDVTESRRAEEERKQAEQALRASEARFRTFVDHATDAFMLHHEDGTVLDVNRQACESLGYSRDELIGMSPTDFDPDVNAARLQQINERRDAGETVTFESHHRRKDGTVFPVEVRLRDFRQGGQRLGISLTRDITERKRAEAEARENEQRYSEMQMELAHANRVATMGQLTASIAHEVNQPIAAARIHAAAALRFLSRNPPDLEEVRQALGSVVKDTDRAGDIVHRIRALVKKEPLQNAHFDINDAINELMALAQSEVLEKGVTVRIRLAEALSPVWGDRVQLQQVVLNLILNAVEAMSAVDDALRELSISTERLGVDEVLVAVRDSGPGIDPEHLERVFDSFYTTKPSGMGLGLSICRSIIEAHGGRLWANANVPRGAIFQFTVPAVEGM